VEDDGDPMNTFRDPATNVSIHVPHESDDRAWRNMDTANAGAVSDDGVIGTGRAVKYSPVAQERAREHGKATPEEITKELAGFGQIHAKE